MPPPREWPIKPTVDGDGTPSSACGQRIDDPAGIVQLGGERVVAEPIGKREVARVVHSAPAQVEAHRGEAGLGQALAPGGGTFPSP